MYRYFWVALAQFIAFFCPPDEKLYINTSVYTEGDNC